MRYIRSVTRPRGRGFAALLAVLLAAACGDGPTEPRPAPHNPPPVASVAVTPDTVELPVGGTRGLHAEPRAGDGRPLPERPVAWTSSDPAVARVDDSGNVTALREGSAVVTAVSEGRQGRARVRVVGPPPAVPVAWVQVVGGGVELEPGRRHRLRAALFAADGTELAGRPVAWSSSDTLVARVDDSGWVTPLRGGTVTVTATSEGRRGGAMLYVSHWLRHDVLTVDGAPAPALLRVRADTLERTAWRVVVRERREWLRTSRFWTSTVDWRYRQLFELETRERTVTYLNGGSIVGAEVVTDQRVVRDEGEAREFELHTGDPLYRSYRFAGHGFVARAAGPGLRVIRQSIPGEGSGSFDFRYDR